MKTQLLKEWLKAKHVGQAFQPAIHWPEFRSFTKEDLGAVGLYQRRLPHWELQGSTYFITFRVHEGLGRPLIGSLKDPADLPQFPAQSSKLESQTITPQYDDQVGRLESLLHISPESTVWGRLSSLPSAQLSSEELSC